MNRASLGHAMIIAALRKRTIYSQLSIGLIIFVCSQSALFLLQSLGLIVDYSISHACVVIAAIWGGLWSGITTAVLSAAWIDLYFNMPRWKIFDTFGDVLRFVVYIVIAIIVSKLTDLLRTSYINAESARKEATLQSHARESIVEIIAHDLKNPISAILLNVSLVMKIAERKNWNDNSIPKLRKTAKTVLKMGQTISDLVQLSEMEFGTYRITPADQSLANLLQKICAWE
jgi:K+-sensing histidine kinase KdpD